MRQGRVRGEDGTEWEYHRTCSRVSGGPCADCKRETFFGYWARMTTKGQANPPREHLCAECWEKRYDHEAAAKRAEERKAAEIDKAERRVFAQDEVRRRREGLPPAKGWHREGKLIVNDATGEKRGFF